ncbi:MAG: Rha family transcriptional regulator [Brochothrix thermosphacta]|uniref:Rha family transcriptional regulator n=1 Tax=Brochothrix thermosphacta TaxID=2756 RepID=UPI003F929E63
MTSLATIEKPTNKLVDMKNNEAVTSSLQIADKFEKQHKHVLDVIEGKLKLAELSAHYKSLFTASVYKDSRGRKQKMYYMNRDGFAFIAMGFNGRKADSFKLQYIAQFNEMERQIKQQPIQTELSLPQNYAQALRQLANTVEENEQLKSELEVKRSQQLTLEAPQKLYTTDSIARELGYPSAAALNKQMHYEKFVYFKKGNWVLYKSYQKKCLKDMSTLSKSRLWTEEGRYFIKMRFGKEYLMP